MFLENREINAEIESGGVTNASRNRFDSTFACLMHQFRKSSLKKTKTLNWER